MLIDYFPFSTPRDEQVYAISSLDAEFVDKIDKKFAILELPTGVGKSGIGYCISKYYESIGIKSLIITKTKILQDQYTDDFSDIISIKGKGNYSDESEYEKQLFSFDNSNIRITNYSKLESVNSRNNVLIIDEAPEFISHLSGQLIINFKLNTNIKGLQRIVEFLGDFKSVKLKSLLTNLYYSKLSLIGKGKKFGLTAKDHEMIRFCKLVKILYHSSKTPDDIKVIVKKTQDSMTLFVNAIPELFQMLINSHKKVIMMSANFGGIDFFLSMLGQKKKNIFLYSTSESPFDRLKRPIRVIKSHSIGTSDKLNRVISMTKEVIDPILDIEHLIDNNGIIHTVSYENAILIKENSKYSDRMEIIRSPSQLSNLNEVKGRIILSPALEEGVSFKGDLAVYQIIAKCPIEPVMGLNSFMVKIFGKKYINWRSALRIVQMYGRIIRSEECEGTTYISDANFSRVCGPSSKTFYPKYFFDNIKKLKTANDLVA
jgi:Rad3-related DNA helicase